MKRRSRVLWLRWLVPLVVTLTMLAGPVLVTWRDVPDRAVAAVQRQPTPTPTPRTGIIDHPIVIPIPTTPPTRPPRVTEVPTTPPRVVPTIVPTEPVIPTVDAPKPQPGLPDKPDTRVTLPPVNIEPFLPGTGNRFQITVYTCAAETDASLAEADLLATCPLHQGLPPDGDVGFQLRDGDQTHTSFDPDHDSVHVFDQITIFPGPRFFIGEEFRDGYGDPAVFCSEGGAPHARIETEYRVIRPQLSQFTNVDYTCAWFRIPLQGDTVRVHDMLCQRDPGEAAGFDWHWVNCQPTDATTASTFILADTSGDQPMLADDGEAIWTNVDFGATESVTIERIVATGSLPYRVFCGTFNSGTQMPASSGVVTIERSPDPPPVEYTCRWYRYLGPSDIDDGIQVPGMLHAKVYACPAGQEQSAAIETLLGACTDPNPGVEIGFAYPGTTGFQTVAPAAGSNPGSVSFGLVGEGTVGATASTPAGYDPPVVFCQNATGAPWNAVGNGINGSVNLHFSWGQESTCAWFFFPQGNP